MLRSESCMAETIPAGSYGVSPRQTKNADGTITVTVQAVGSLNQFDIGVVYDKTKLKVVSLGFDSSFYSDYTRNSNGIALRHSLDSYCVFGGVWVDDDWRHVGNVAKVTFSVIGNDPGKVMVVLDSAKYKNAFSNAVNVPSTKVITLRK